MNSTLPLKIKNHLRAKARGRTTKKLKWLCILFLMTFFWASQSGVAQPGKNPKESEGLILLPRVGLELEYGGFLKRPGDIGSLLRRRLEMDVLQHERHILYLDIDEETLFGSPRDAWALNQARFRLNLFGYRYDLGEHYLGVLVNHPCFNILLTEKFPEDSGRLQISSYFFTLEFLTKTLRLGMKDREVDFNPQRPFAFLGRFHYGASIGKRISNQDPVDPYLDWVIKGQLRYDIFRYWRFIPYLEFIGELRLGDSNRFSPRAEVGVRYHLRNHVNITPFFQWGRSQEFLKERGDNQSIKLIAQTFVLGGMRVEALLEGQEKGGDGGEEWQFLTEIHGQADYVNYPSSRFFGWAGFVDLNFEVLRRNPWTLFFYSHLDFNTRKSDFGMRKATGRFQYGITYTRTPFFMEGFVENAKRMDVNAPSGGISERSNLAGVRLGTLGMKPGQVNYGISFRENTNFQWLHNIQVQGSFGHFFHNRNWQYLWRLGTQARWDVCRWYFVIPYIEGEINWLTGGGDTSDALEYAMETGLRLHGHLDLGLYYRFQHRENAQFFRGSADDQNLLGIRVLF